MTLIPVLRKEGVAVERELARIQEQAKTYPPAHQQLMAIRFYLQYALWKCQKRWFNHHSGITNYATLIREIDRWRFEFNEQVSFVTFNYDTMLEQAMFQVLGFNLQDFKSYTSQKHYSVIKLHGSINWGRGLAGISSQDSWGYPRIIKEAANLTLSTNYVLVNTPFDATNALIPALAIPVEKKDEFSCPETHVKGLEGLLPSVTKLLIIGWRATEVDFLNMPRSHLRGTPDAMIVSGDSAGVNETLTNLDPSRVRYAGQNSIDIGFSGLIDNLGLLEAFLRNASKPSCECSLGSLLRLPPFLLRSANFLNCLC